ncbi:hypothetical protein B0H15DRAFT_1018962 [Mycena belliarum]|uniref:Uncharacterized protein n=1 Tax=Mycena belliarum TaxID=1033014 RepID=A0AAD6UC83_9AGAR|nr:hypothetical protein B0H15DRAFT_1018962 [Mycena belliae]
MAAPRRTHRKRISLRLSSDTTSTLPEYQGWRDIVPPPEYEADDDTDADADTDEHKPPVSPRLPPHSRRPHQHQRRRTASPLPQDAFLDSLLERSVHALELSNALLQSSMTPTSSSFRESEPEHSVHALQSRTSSAFREMEPERSVRALQSSTSSALRESELERSVRALQSNTSSAFWERDSPPTAPVAMPPAREAWADELAAIARDVDDLVSSSLPSIVSASASDSPIHRPRRRPSLDQSSSTTAYSSHSHSRSSSTSRSTAHSHSRSAYSAATSATTSPGSGSGSGLRIAPQPRARLIAPAPRALTQFVSGGGAADGTIALPSTLGLRAAPSDWRGLGLGISLSPSIGLDARPPEPATPAYALLSAFVHPTSPPASVGRSSPARGRTQRGLSSPSRGRRTPPARVLTPPLERGSLSVSPPASRRTVMAHRNASALSISTARPIASSVPTISHTLPSSPPRHSASSSSDGDVDGGGVGGRAKATRSALRLILDKAPKPPPPPSRRFQPASPPPAATTAPPSTATASVSRLFSRGGRHSVSTAPAPVQGIMKVTPHHTPTASLSVRTGNAVAGPSNAVAGSSKDGAGSSNEGVSAPSTPGASPSAFWARATGGGSRGTSGASTPASSKRISFAQLPESYASSRPAGSARGKSKSKSKSKVRKGKGKGDGDAEGGWLAWLLGVGAGGASAMGAEERERLGVGGMTGGVGGRGSGVWGVGAGGGIMGRGAGDEWSV